MKKYNENIIELLTPPAKKSYISLCRKSENIYNKIRLIEDVEKIIMQGLPAIDKNDERDLLNNIYEFSEYIYCCMEYVGQIIRDACRISISEELKDGFNSVLSDASKYKSGKKQSNVYSNIVIRNYITQAQEWYELIHCIRTEETHYGTGEIAISELKKDTLIYKNTLRNGKGNFTEISIEIKQLFQIYTLFCMFLDNLDTMIDYIINNNK